MVHERSSTGLGDVRKSKWIIKMSLAVISRAFCLALLTAGTVLSTSNNLEDSHIHEDAVDIGNWTVGDCILAKFAMDFTVSV